MARRPIAIHVGRSTIRSSAPYAATEAGMRANLQTSISGIVNNIKAFIADVEGMMPDVLVEVLQPVFDLSQVYCPFKSGDLRSSGYLEARQGTRTAEVEIGYGRGGHPSYAVYVHEMPFNHADPTRDKFLQAALDEGLPDALASLPSIIRARAGT
jgi:hypothetical protein